MRQQIERKSTHSVLYHSNNLEELLADIEECANGLVEDGVKREDIYVKEGYLCGVRLETTDEHRHRKRRGDHQNKAVEEEEKKEMKRLVEKYGTNGFKRFSEQFCSALNLYD